MDGFVVLRETRAILNTLMSKATLAFILLHCSKVTLLVVTYAQLQFLAI